MKYKITRNKVTITEAQQSFYDRYIQSSQWKVLCQLHFQKSGFRCRLCNGSEGGLILHHRSYKNLGHERAMDLVVLCKRCHDFFHANIALVTETRTKIALLRNIMNTVKEEIIAYDKKDTQAIFHTCRKTIWKQLGKKGIKPITTILDEKGEIFSKVFFIPKELLKEVL